MRYISDFDFCLLGFRIPKHFENSVCFRRQVEKGGRRDPNPVGPSEKTSLYRHMHTHTHTHTYGVHAAHINSSLSTLSPCHVTVSGCRASFNPVMLWSVCVYAGLITALWFAYSKDFFEAMGAQSFDSTILQYQDLAYHLIDLAVPINNWREARMIAVYMASWSAFQVINN